MPMANVFSPRSSTFLIDNLLKTGGDDQRKAKIPPSMINSEGKPCVSLENLMSYGTVPLSVSNYNSNSSSSSNSNSYSSTDSNTTNTNSGLPFHPAFRHLQQTTVSTLPPAKPEIPPHPQPLEARTYSPASNHETESSSAGPTKRKKNRTNFTTRQISELENKYRTQRYLAPHERTSLARALNLTDRQVKTWFQNRRMKEKRQTTDADSFVYKGYSPEAHSPTVTPTSVQHHHPTTSASGAAAPPPPLFTSPSVAPPVVRPVATLGMTAQVSSAPIFQPLSIAVPSVRYKGLRPHLGHHGPGLLMVDGRQTYTNL